MQPNLWVPENSQTKKPEELDKVAARPSAAAAAAPKMRIPKELVGKGTAATRDGRRLCFAFNLAVGCTEALAGADCKKGAHACMFDVGGFACGQPHSIAQHA